MVMDLRFWHPFKWIRPLKQLRTLLNCENLSAANQVSARDHNYSLHHHTWIGGGRSFDLMLMLTQPGFKKVDLLRVDSASPFWLLFLRRRMSWMLPRDLRGFWERVWERSWKKIYWISVFWEKKYSLRKERVWERIYWDLRKRRGWVCSCWDLKRKEEGFFRFDKKKMGWDGNRPQPSTLGSMKAKSESESADSAQTRPIFTTLHPS